MTNGAPIHIKPEQAISEAAALGEKIARGVALFSKLHDDDVAIATTPKDEVWRQDKVSLYHYRPLADKKLARPQSPQSRYRSLRGGLGQPVARRPLAHAR